MPVGNPTWLVSQLFDQLVTGDIGEALAASVNLDAAAAAGAGANAGATGSNGTAASGAGASANTSDSGSGSGSNTTAAAVAAQTVNPAASAAAAAGGGDNSSGTTQAPSDSCDKSEYAAYLDRLKQHLIDQQPLSELPAMPVSEVPAVIWRLSAICMDKVTHIIHADGPEPKLLVYPAQEGEIIQCGC